MAVRVGRTRSPRPPCGAVRPRVVAAYRGPRRPPPAPHSAPRLAGRPPAYWQRRVDARGASEHSWSDPARAASTTTGYEHRTIPLVRARRPQSLLETDAELGIVGLALLLSTLGAPLVAAARARKRKIVATAAGRTIRHFSSTQGSTGTGRPRSVDDRGPRLRRRVARRRARKLRPGDQCQHGRPSGAALRDRSLSGPARRREGGRPSGSGSTHDDVSETRLN